jgi:hypothetical protein
MVRKLGFSALLGVLALAGVAFVGAPGVSAAGPSGAACRLDGQASFSTGLGVAPTNYDYTFTGDLTGCHSSDTTAPTSGHITAYSIPSTNTGSCAYALPGNGRATVTWGDIPSTTSEIAYTTRAAGATVVVNGVVESGRYAGNTVVATLAFQTQTPQDCATTGLTSAAFTGTAAIGNTE